jgi:hypothetical protein
MPNLLQTPAEEMSRRQADLTPLLSLNIDFDIEHGRALYLSQDGAVSEVELVPLCSFGTRSQTTHWAWANPGLGLPLAYGETVFRKLAEETGFDDLLRREPARLPEGKARDLLALLVERLHGLGLVERQHDDTVWSFMIIRLEENIDLTRVTADSLQLIFRRLLDMQEIDLFNKLRRRHPDIILDFTKADLRGAALPWKGDLHLQILFDRERLAGHRPRVLDGIDLSNSRLYETNLRGVSLRKASLKSGVLVDADLTGADLTGANLEAAFLNGTNFTGTKLDQTSFTQAELGRTLFIDTDLSSVRGLDEVHHSTTSEIAFSTLVNSSFQVSETFLRAAGVSIGIIEDLKRGQRFASTYATCFLSYSTNDSVLAQKMYYALIEAGVRVYWDRTDLTAGESLEVQLGKAIREYDRTIAILSENSLDSVWLKRETEIALYYKPQGFTPIRICEIKPIREFVAKHEIKPDIVERYPILDFSGWETEAEFERLRELLLRSIRK